ncbi:hypothetical protein H2204_006190 [Knufia peltigerae]|uniref:Laccase n=1 Tax=Knufia peltigerae TaxID=1002370 RepID=A0AA38Y4F3_9EURO|nr:hypothetical protein H2204_006190 [Knufia peltigerae]
MERTNSRRRKAVPPVVESIGNNSSEQEVIPPQPKSASVGSSIWDVSRRPWTCRPAYMIVILLIFAITGILLVGRLQPILQFVSTTGYLRQHNDAPVTVPGDLRVILHPEEHVSRPPTTLVYNWTITKGHRWPDGVSKEVYLINDRFPGETIEARPGDRIVVNVVNQLSHEGLALHWHGLRMVGANDMDGAVGLTQNPIPAGGSFRYEFSIGEEEFGTFWYHGHEKTQRDDGLYGGLVVHRPFEQRDEQNHYGYDEDILLMVGDWYHRPSQDVLSWYMNSRSFGNEPVPDSLLVNGIGNFNCEMAVPARPLQCLAPDERSQIPLLPLMNGKRTRLRLVNTGSLAGFSIQIAGASLLPFQVDGGNEVIMTEAHGIGIVYPGERVDAILQTRSLDSQSFIEIKMDDENFKYPNPALELRQIFPVQIMSDTNIDVRSSLSVVDYYNLQAAKASANTRVAFSETPLKFVIYTTTLKLAKHHNIPMGFINHTSWSPQLSGPLISISRSQYDQNQLSPHIPLSSKVKDEGTGHNESDGWVEVVINNLDDGGHPFHLHGYSFYIVSVFPRPPEWTNKKPPFTPGGSSMYNFNPFATAPQDSPGGEYNLVDPVMKDTVFVPQRGYAVIRFQADNKGIWMLHCHVGWHLGSGMAMSWDIS